MAAKKFTYVQTQPTAEDRAEAEYLLEVVEDAMQSQGARPLELNGLPTKRPALLFAAFDLFLDIYQQFAAEGDEHEDALNTVLALVSNLLYELRLAIENNEAKATTIWERFQAYMGDQLFNGDEVPESLLLFNLMNMLQQSGLPVGDKLVTRFQETMEMNIPADMEVDINELDGLMVQLLDEAEAKSPFDLFNLLLGQLNMMPADALAMIFSHMSQNENPILNELAFLMLLHPQRDVRIALGQILATPELPKHLTPTTLRRLIGIRNWVPEDERPSIDLMIKDARSSGIECALTPKAPANLRYFGSTIDGAGAQTAWVHYSAKRKHHLVGFLAKQGFGLREVMVYENVSKAQADLIIEQFSWEIGMEPIKPELLEFLIPHYLAINLKNGTPPPAGLLQLAELLGIEYWRPQHYSAELLIQMLEAPQQPEDFDELVAEALEDSAEWLDDYSWAESWFESGEALQEILEEQVGKNWRRSRKKSPQVILQHVLQQKRAIWTERVLLTALWQKCTIAPEDWEDSLIVGKQLADPGVPLQHIPLMTAIADLSFEMLLEMD